MDFFIDKSAEDRHNPIFHKNWHSMKKSLPPWLFCAAAVLSFGVAQSSFAQEVVVNGGFETGSFPPWTEDDPSPFTNIGSDPLFAHSGTYHANLGADGTPRNLEQTLTTTPGLFYDLSFWLANDSGEPTNSFDVFWDGALVLSLANAPVFNYTQYNYSLQALDSSTVLKFTYRNDDDFFRLDDVSAVGIPEPSVTWLILPALGVLGLVKYRGAKHRGLAAKG